MSTLSEYTSNVWIIPLAILGILPFVLFIIASVTRILKNKELNAKTAVPNITNGKTVQTNKDCARQHERIEVEGIRADISDGKSSYTGLITNVSKLGLCLKDVPENLSTSRSLLSVVVRSKTESYRIVARPRWEIPQNNTGKTIGAEIASCSSDWGDFVHSH